MKRSFSLLEVVLVVFLISIIYFYQKNLNYSKSNLDTVVNRVVLYLKHTRYQALIDDKRDEENSLWHKKRWTMKFLRCKEKIGGIYYVIYSDSNMTGQPSKEESLIDPLTKKKVFSSNNCQSSKETSKYVLLTKEFGIKNIDMSCNSTTSLGQISFGHDGKVYSKLSNNNDSSQDYEIKNRCKITFISENNFEKSIYIVPKTGYIFFE